MAPDCGIEQDGRDRTNRPTRSTHKSRPNTEEAVVEVFYTERTPRKDVQLLRARLADPNNRYQPENPRKLILSSTSYEYEEAPDEGEA